MSDIRPLTREEQLQWLTSFLEEQILQMQKELQVALEELNQIQDNKEGKQLALTKEYNNNERR